MESPIHGIRFRENLDPRSGGVAGVDTDALERNFHELADQYTDERVMVEGCFHTSAALTVLTHLCRAGCNLITVRSYQEAGQARLHLEDAGAEGTILVPSPQSQAYPGMDIGFIYDYLSENGYVPIISSIEDLEAFVN